MPRRSSGGRSRSRSRSPPHNPPKPGRSGRRAAACSHSPLRNPPKPVAHAPPPAHVKGANSSVMGGLGGAIAEGMAFGAGNAMANRVVDAVLGPRVIKHETTNMNSLGESNACAGQSKALQDCLNNYGSDISKCQFYMDMLQECRKGSVAVKGVPDSDKILV